MNRVAGLAALLTLACAVGGCGAKLPVRTYPVSGQVLYGGKPAAGVQVFLLPTSAPTVPDIPSNPRGLTGADGRFTLGTFTAEDGAAPGGYQVILLWPPETTEGEEATTDRLLGWYSAVHSQLTTDIKPEENRLPVFNLPVVTRPPDAVQGVPGRN